jgi:hypothetical protein
MRYALPGRPRRGWGSSLAHLVGQDAARIRPPITMPHLKFLEDDAASDEPFDRPPSRKT